MVGFAIAGLIAIVVVNIVFYGQLKKSFKDRKLIWLLPSALILNMSSRNYLHQEEKRGEGLRLRQLPNLAAPGRLSQLNFSRNDIRCLPPRLADAQQLQMLDLSHNKIARIELLGAIPSLKFLNLSHNLIAEVPQEITHLVQLENLDLSFNHLATLGSVRALKEVFRIRLVDKGGFVEINI